MGAFDQAPNITVPDDDGDPIAAAAFRQRWKWETYEVVIMRGTYTAGDLEAVNNVLSRLDKQKNPQIVGGTARLHMLHRLIVGWTFKAGGRDVPVSLDAIRRLPANYMMPLLQKGDEIASGAMTEEEQTDFFPSANGHSEENSIETSLSLFPS